MSCRAKRSNLARFNPSPMVCATVIVILLQAVGIPASSVYAQTNPVPFVNQPLVPDAAAPGGTQFTLTVNGTGFVTGSVVNWNGSGRATTFVSGSQLTAAIPGTDIATAGSASVTVVNPAPGGGTSNTVLFPITSPASTLEFVSSPTLSTGAGPSSVAAADFNGDGKLDLAVTNSGDSTVSIFLGNGDGTFQSRVDYATAPGGYFVVTAHFNGDGHLDLAVITAGSCDEGPPSVASILLGNGDGTFQAHVDSELGCASSSVVAADFNGDGKLDLASTVVPRDSFSIVLGNGDGSFQPPVDYGLPPSPGYTGAYDAATLVTGDFNGDGKLDLAVWAAWATFPFPTDSSLYLFLGNGDGTFATTPSSVSVGGFAGSLVAADFNRDGKLDLALVAPDVVSSVGDTILEFGNGDGTFESFCCYTTSAAPGSLAIGDFNGDGALDLAVAGYTILPFHVQAGDVSVLLGRSDGTFESPVDFIEEGTGVTSLAIGDFNADGRLDMAVVNGGNNVSILMKPVTTVTLTPPSLFFDLQAVGTTSDPLTTTLENTGGASLRVDGITVTDSGEFALASTSTCPLNGGSLNVGASCTIDVTFSPTEQYNFEASVNIADNAAGSPQSVYLNGTGTAPLVSLSPTSLTFAGQNVGTTSNQVVTLTNISGTSISLTSVAATGDFRAFKLCPQSIAPKGSCKINVVFTPAQTGVRNGTLTIFMKSVPGHLQSVALRGTGTAPAVGLSTTSLTFAGQLVGASSTAQTVTLTNTGDGPLTISSIGAKGDFTSTPGQCAGTVATGASCAITVVFKPQAGGSRTGTLSVADDASGSPQTVALAGTGQDFAVSASTASATVTAGQTASYTLSLTSEGGFSGAVSLTCTGAPTTAMCSLTPSSVTLAGSGATPVTVRVATTARSMAPPTGHHPPGLGSPKVLLLAWLMVLWVVLSTRAGSMLSKKRRLWAPLSAALLLVMLWTACGGGTPAPPPVMGTPAGTPAGTYTLTVAATGSGLTSNVSLTLVVN